MNLEEIIQETKTYYCLECGKCTSLCPISRFDPAYSPRVVVEEALLGLRDDIVHNKKLFSCLTCSTCSLKCPADVDYPSFVRGARSLANEEGEAGFCAHAGALQSIARLQARSNLVQRRLEWLDRDKLRVSDDGEVLLFVGCAPYFEPVFEDIPVRALDIAESTIRILNHLGIEPQVHGDEKCCGHDALWLGDVDTFERLSNHNVELIRDSGAKTVLCFCPECFRTLASDYPDLDCEVLHVSEFLARKIDSGELTLAPREGRVTYQDPCRLGRHMNLYDAPRKVLSAIDGLELVEMEHHREDAVCCGTSCFTNCDSYSKRIRVDRLMEAEATGAQTLVTACPKCQTHFKCALNTRGEQSGPEVHYDVVDLVNLVEESIEAAADERQKP